MWNNEEYFFLKNKIFEKRFSFCGVEIKFLAQVQISSKINKRVLLVTVDKIWDNLLKKENSLKTKTFLYFQINKINLVLMQQESKIFLKWLQHDMLGKLLFNIVPILSSYVQTHIL